jgi:L-lactate dehydrogenase (cytochrome)
MGTLNLQPATVGDYRALAERRLPRGLFGYLDGGAGEEVSLRQNSTDFENLRLRQRVMRDVSKVETSTTLFGEPLKMPLILAPVGMAGMMARRSEMQAKRAADKAGIPFCLSTVGICPAEEVATVSDKPFWFQLYMLKDRGIVKEMLDHVWAQGIRTLVFTVDLAVMGARYRDVRNGLTGGLRDGSGCAPGRLTMRCTRAGSMMSRCAVVRTILATLSVMSEKADLWSIFSNGWADNSMPR